MYATGRFSEGIEEMTRLAHHWENCMPFMVTHNWFHMCLFHLELCEDGGEEQLTRLREAFEGHVWTDRTDKYNIQVNIIVDVLVNASTIFFTNFVVWNRVPVYSCHRFN